MSDNTEPKPLENKTLDMEKINKLENLLLSDESRNLNHYPLGEYLEKVVFKEPLVIEKLKRENVLFLFLYHKEIVEKTQITSLKNKYNNLALRWLMNLYS
jgi:hypothetical protein